MSENNLWFGYLDAGEKSSPVVIDTRLNTANPNTVYLFNHTRGEIIEYRRDIIEPKLRPLAQNDNHDEKTLKSAYLQIRGGFTPRGGKAAAIPEKAIPKSAAKKMAPVDDEDEEVESFIGGEAGSDEDWDDS